MNAIYNEFLFYGRKKHLELSVARGMRISMSVVRSNLSYDRLQEQTRIRLT